MVSRDLTDTQRVKAFLPSAAAHQAGEEVNDTLVT